MKKKKKMTSLVLIMLIFIIETISPVYASSKPIIDEYPDMFVYEGEAENFAVITDVPLSTDGITTKAVEEIGTGTVYSGKYQKYETSHVRYQIIDEYVYLKPAVLVTISENLGVTGYKLTLTATKEKTSGTTLRLKYKKACKKPTTAARREAAAANREFQKHRVNIKPVDLNTLSSLVIIFNDKGDKIKKFQVKTSRGNIDVDYKLFGEAANFEAVVQGKKLFTGVYEISRRPIAL